MPLPEPQSNESEEDFVASCMGNEVMKKEFSDQKQRSAVCYSQYRKSKTQRTGMSEPIPILRSFESEGKRYVYGYAAIFDSEDSYGTAMTREAVEASLPRLQSFPAVHFMHRVPFGQIIFDETVEGAKTFVDNHGFHVLCRIYDQCTTEWGMVKAGKWGFSYGFMPDAQGGIETRKLANGHTVPAFVKGTFYEVSVVDAPAHSDAVAYVINRMIHGDTGEIITEGISLENENKGNKEEFEQWCKDAETRMTAYITKLLEGKQSKTSFEDALKAMEARMMSTFEQRLAAQVPEKSIVEKTFESVNGKLAAMDQRITKLKGIEKEMKNAGEEYKTFSERIAAYEKERDAFANSITDTVAKTVERSLGKVEDRLSAIENIPDLRSPATLGEKSGVTRGMGFANMFEAARSGTE